MKEEAKKIIDREILKLSKEKQDAINSFNWIDVVEKIGTKNLFNEVEIKDLIIETGLVLVGLVNPNTYMLNIENNIGTSRKEAEEITEEIFNKIFTPIADKLDNQTEEEVEKIPTPPIKRGNTPVDFKGAIDESDWQTKIYSIGQKYNLSIDQMGTLEEITTKVIIGETPSDKFDDEIKSKINLPEEKILELISDLNDSIFKNIREIMKTQEEIPTPNYTKTEEVPIPNYDKQNETKIYSDHGIEMVEEKKEVVRENGNSQIDEKQILEDSGIDIIDEKLNKPVVGFNKVSDYSIPKMGSENNDSYREKI